MTDRNAGNRRASASREHPRYPLATQRMPDRHATELVRMGNATGNWAPMLAALRAGYMRPDYSRAAADGSMRPSLLTMIMIHAPVTVVREAITLGAPVDADHLIPAAASGCADKLALIRNAGHSPAQLSLPPEYLLLAAVNGRGDPDHIRRVWSLHSDWNPARAREVLRVFDCALRKPRPPEVLRLLLEHGIGPSSHMLNQGVPEMPTGATSLLVEFGWPIPPVQACSSRDIAYASPRIH